MTIQEVVTGALVEIGVARGGDAPRSEDADYACTILNRIFDDLNAEDAGVYGDTFVPYTLTPNLHPHTIGPTGTFVVTQRPEAIGGANLVLTTVTPSVRQPIYVRDRAWWLNQRIRDLATSFPTDLFYRPDWPNGELNFWPVPTAALQVELMTRILLAAVALTDTFSLPPGYQSFLTLTLAEQICEPMGQPLSPGLVQHAQQARARVFGRNTVTPRLHTADAGIPRGRRSGRGFNYLTRRLS